MYVNGAIERDSFLQGGAYFGKDLNPLYLVYRTAARLAGVRRVVEKSAACPNVGLTEHPDGTGRVIVVAINYDPEPVTCPIRVAGRVGTVYRGTVADGQIVLAANDVAIFELKAGERPVPGGEIVYDWTVKGGRREETFAAPPGWRLIHCHAQEPECSRPSFVMRFDDNKPVSQWREVAEIFETIGGRCSFAVNAATLDDRQWAALRDLAARGHEIMDHTAQHAVFKLLCATAAEADRHRLAEFFDHVEQDGRLVLCRPELDLGCAANVRVQATMTNGVLRSSDPVFLSAQGFSRKFHVPSVGRTYGFGKDCGNGLFKKGPEQRCSDFWGRWTTDSFGPCEIVILAEEAVQPSLDLLRAQAQASVSLFVAHGLPRA